MHHPAPKSHQTPKKKGRRKALTLAAVLGLGTAGFATTTHPNQANAETPTQDTPYINAIYRGLIGREPTPTELATAMTQINTEGRSTFTNALVKSDAWLGHFVDDLYDQAFSRTPDTEGRTYWIGRLRDGATTVDVAAFVLGSKEFRQRSGGTNRSIIQNMYQRVLGRDADTKGLDYWENELDRVGIDVISRGFFQSKENRLRRVGLLYDQLLCRPGETKGAQYWAGRMENESDHVLSLFIASSDEFATNSTSEECRGLPTEADKPDPGDGVDLTTLGESSRVLYFDDAANELITHNRPDQDGVSVISSIDGNEIRHWGAEGKSTRVLDIGHDGRYVLLSTNDPELTGSGPDSVDSYGMVLIDRSDNTSTPLSVPSALSGFQAQISDDAKIVWIGAKGDAFPDDGLDTQHGTNLYRIDRSIDSIEMVTAITTPSLSGRFSYPLGASADGNTVLVSGGVSRPFGNDQSDLDQVGSYWIWLYDADTENWTEVPFGFRRFGPGGILDSSGDRVIGAAAAFSNRSTFLFDRGDTEVELLGMAQTWAAADIDGDGTLVVWTKESILNADHRAFQTIVGVRSPGVDDRTFTIPGEVTGISLAASGASFVVTYTPAGKYDEQIVRKIALG